MKRDIFEDHDPRPLGQAQVAYFNKYKAHQRRIAQERRLRAILGASLASVSVLAMLGLAAFNNRGNTRVESVPTEVLAVQEAHSRLIADHDRFMEKVSRYDRAVTTFSETPGLQQQLIANIAAQKADAIALQQRDPNHPAYRKHESVAWLFADINANEKMLLGSMGVGAVLEYNRLDGTKVREAVSPDGLMLTGMLASQSNNLAQSLTVRPIFDKNAILTEMAQYQHPLKLSRAAHLAAQGLVDPAAELQSIDAFQGRLSR